MRHCERCPDILNRAGTLPTSKDKCTCDSTIYDTLADGFFNSLNSEYSGNMTKVTHQIIENLAQDRQEDLVDSVLHLFSLLYLDAVADAKDLQFMHDTMEKHTKIAMSKFTAHLQILFNPYILNNYKVNLECRGDHVCILKGLLFRREKVMVKFISYLVPDVIDGLIDGLEDLKEHLKICGENECVFTRALVKNKEHIREMLEDSKVMKDFIAKYIVSLMSRILKTDMEHKYLPGKIQLPSTTNV